MADWNEASLVRLNNAIAQLERAAGHEGPARKLAEDWVEWWDSSLLRSLGVLGVPFVYGAANGFWERYRDVYLDILAQGPPTVALVPPDALRPTVKSLLTQAGAAAVDANREVVDRAYDAAKRGARVALDVVETSAETLAQPIGDLAEQARATRQMILAGAGIVALIWAIGQLRR